MTTNNSNQQRVEQIETLHTERSAFVDGLKNLIDKEKFTQEDGTFSEEEYRKVLMETYKAARQSSYDYTVRYRCVQTYNDGCNMNRSNPRDFSKSSIYKNSTIPQDSTLRRIPVLAATTMGMTDCDRPLNTCSLTCAAIGQCVAEDMGYTGNDNPIIAKNRGDNPHFKKNNLNDARGIAYLDSFPADCRLETNKKTTARELIANGQLKTGDIISVYNTEPASNTSTGYHALTIAGIDTDENGKVTGYTLMANNGLSLKHYDINDKTGYANKPLQVTARCSQWMDNCIEREVQDLQNLSTEELQARVEEAITETRQASEKLHESEQTNYSNYNRKSNTFTSSYQTQITTVRDTTNRVLQTIRPEFQEESERTQIINEILERFNGQQMNDNVQQTRITLPQNNTSRDATEIKESPVIDVDMIKTPFVVTPTQEINTETIIQTQEQAPKMKVKIQASEQTPKMEVKIQASEQTPKAEVKIRASEQAPKAEIKIQTSEQAPKAETIIQTQEQAPKTEATIQTQEKAYAGLAPENKEQLHDSAAAEQTAEVMPEPEVKATFSDDVQMTTLDNGDIMFAGTMNNGVPVHITTDTNGVVKDVLINAHGKYIDYQCTENEVANVNYDSAFKYLREDIQQMLAESGSAQMQAKSIQEALQPVAKNTAAELIDVQNLTAEQQHDIKMLFLRDPAEANELLGKEGKAWMNSRQLQEAWDKPVSEGGLTDAQKADLVKFAGERFDERGNFVDVDGKTSAAQMEADARAGRTTRRRRSSNLPNPTPEEAYAKLTPEGREQIYGSAVAEQIAKVVPEPEVKATFRDDVQMTTLDNGDIMFAGTMNNGVPVHITTGANGMVKDMIINAHGKYADYQCTENEIANINNDEAFKDLREDIQQMLAESGSAQMLAENIQEAPQPIVEVNIEKVKTPENSQFSDVVVDKDNGNVSFTYTRNNGTPVHATITPEGELKALSIDAHGDKPARNYTNKELAALNKNEQFVAIQQAWHQDIKALINGEQPVTHEQKSGITHPDLSKVSNAQMQTETVQEVPQPVAETKSADQNPQNKTNNTNKKTSLWQKLKKQGEALAKQSPTSFLGFVAQAASAYQTTKSSQSSDEHTTPTTVVSEERLPEQEINQSYEEAFAQPVITPENMNMEIPTQQNASLNSNENSMADLQQAFNTIIDFTTQNQSGKTLTEKDILQSYEEAFAQPVITPENMNMEMPTQQNASLSSNENSMADLQQAFNTIIDFATAYTLGNNSNKEAEMLAINQSSDQQTADLISMAFQLAKQRGGYS